MKKSMIKAFSHKNIDKNENLSINPSKLSVNKKYKIIKSNNINNNIEIHDYEYSNHMNDKNINVNTFSQNHLNINNIVESLSNKNIQINKRNSFKNLKNLTFNHNKNNSNNIISDNLNKKKYKNIIITTNNSDFDNSNLNINYIYLRNKNKNINNCKKISNTNIINDNMALSQNFIDKNKISSINNNNNMNCIYSYNNYGVNYFNKQKHKNIICAILIINSSTLFIYNLLFRSL
jgi:hypothetical protein